MGEFVLDYLDNSHYASTDLFSSMTMIVSAYPQHDNLQQQKIKVCMTHEHRVKIPGMWILAQSLAQ